MTKPILTIGDTAIELAADAHGFTGLSEIDGERVRVHVTVTLVGRRTTTPAKAAFAAN